MDEIVRKLEDAPPAVPPGTSPPGTLELVIRVDAGSEGGQKKRAEVWGETSTGAIRNSRWEMHSDEGRAIGGEDEAPPPLAYFCAGLAF